MNDEQTALGLELGDGAAAVRELAKFIACNPSGLGGTDIYNRDFKGSFARAGMVAAVLTGAGGGERRVEVRRVLPEYRIQKPELRTLAVAAN